MLYNNPLYTLEENLEVAIGGIEFRNKTIKNLRQQIINLREELGEVMFCLDDMTNEEINLRIAVFQFKHLEDSKL